jgi:hypothetical protein
MTNSYGVSVRKPEVRDITWKIYVQMVNIKIDVGFSRRTLSAPFSLLPFCGNLTPLLLCW